MHLFYNDPQHFPSKPPPDHDFFIENCLVSCKYPTFYMSPAEKRKKASADMEKLI